MSGALDVPPLPEGFVRLVASMQLRSDPEQVAALLEGDTPWVSGGVEHPRSPDLRRFAIAMHMRLGGRATGLMKSAYLDVGRVRRTATGRGMEISWLAASAAPLFPVFSGWLTIGQQELRLDGFYAPPGGVAGRVADRVLLHVAANATARWVLSEIDRATLDAAA
ncbi:hypothetical protein BH23CHL9_BH23CHL9_02700 [soil metagenome]